MQRIAVIGLGRFGSRLAASLAAAGQEVVAIDKNRRIVEEMRDRVTLAVALDATDVQALLDQGIDHVDAAVVGIGEDFESAALATAALNQIGVPKVISRSMTPTGARILTRVGADHIVNPEDESADRWAIRLTSPQFLNHYDIAADHSIVEIQTPADWTGKTLADLQLRANAGVHIVAIKTRPQPGPADKPTPTETKQPPITLPCPDQPLREHDRLVIFGRDADLAKLPANAPPASAPPDLESSDTTPPKPD